MGRKRHHKPLRVLFDNRLVGHLSKETSGAIEFRYDQEWLDQNGATPVSLSLPLRKDSYKGAPVAAVFENLLPDSDLLRKRVAEKVGASGTDAYSLLSEIGRDCVGALQFVPYDDQSVHDTSRIDGEPVSDAEIESLLNNLAQTPLGLSQDQQSYTINVAQKYRVNSIFAGVSANWTIFDGLASQAAVRNELARKRQMENDYKDLTERLAQQAQTQVKQINFAARNMSITDRALVASEGNLKTKQEDFARGVTTEDDVSLARITLIDARVNAYNGRIDYLYKTGDFLGILAADPVVANVANAK